MSAWSTAGFGGMAYEFGLPLQEIEVKAVPGSDAWECSGYVAIYNEVDLGNDVILPGAFDQTLAAGHKIKFLREHDRSKVLGTATEWGSDDHGLHGRFKISRTPLGEETYQLLKDGALDSFSIGYITRDADHDAKGVRVLKAVDLLEASVVSLPMQPRALLTAVKGGPGGVAAVPFDDLWQRVRDGFVSLEEATNEAKNLYHRRTSDGRELSGRHREHLRKTLALARLTVDHLARLVDADADDRRPAAKAAAGPVPPDEEAGVDLRLRLHEARRRLVAAGVLPASD